MRALLWITALALGSSVAAAELPAERCTDVEGGLQFCARVEREPRAGERLRMTISTKNLSDHPVSAIDLAKVPSALQASFVPLWVSARPSGSAGRARLKPGYVAVLGSGEALQVDVTTSYVVRVGRNELLVGIPYYWPAAPEFTDEQIRSFYQQAWKAPKVEPLIGPLVFEAN
jgi:hypothetical protein